MHFTFLYKNTYKHTEICLLNAYTMHSWRCLYKVFSVNNKMELKCSFLNIKSLDYTTSIAFFHTCRETDTVI